MLRSHTDHLVITAPSLASGIDHVHDALGVALQRGGEHARMSTHNALLKLGAALYLEVIAVNPEAPKPARSRWFELDQISVDATPSLATWVARTNDIRAASAASPIPLGNIEAMSRGSLDWLITIPADGSLPFDGIAPTLIEWHTAAHPASTLDDLGCSLVKLEGFHAQAEKIGDMLRAIGFQDEFLVSPLPGRQQPHLIAHIQTPTGVRRLGARSR